MKALKSVLAEKILANPDNAAALRHIMNRAGYGLDRAVTVTVVPVNQKGDREPPKIITAYKVPAVR